MVMLYNTMWNLDKLLMSGVDLNNGLILFCRKDMNFLIMRVMISSKMKSLPVQIICLMIPFYGIGNGDYFYHHKLMFENYLENMEKWIAELPDFLE